MKGNLSFSILPLGLDADFFRFDHHAARRFPVIITGKFQKIDCVFLHQTLNHIEIYSSADDGVGTLKQIRLVTPLISFYEHLNMIHLNVSHELSYHGNTMIIMYLY